MIETRRAILNSTVVILLLALAGNVHGQGSVQDEDDRLGSGDVS